MYFFLAQAATQAVTKSQYVPTVALTVVSCVLGICGFAFGVVRYVLSAKIDPINDRLKTLDGQITALESELLRDVKQIAKDNFEHRISSQQSTSDLRLALSEKYVTKEEFDKRMSELSARIELEKELKSINKKLDSLT
jgi:actin-related protein